MFFIMGSGDKQQYLNFDQVVVCKSCGKYGHIRVLMVYSYFSLFFIPLFKWNKRFFVQMSCCNASCKISSELGKEIERGNIVKLNEDILHFNHTYTSGKRCMNCGFTTQEDFDYCPKCGQRF